MLTELLRGLKILDAKKTEDSSAEAEYKESLRRERELLVSQLLVDTQTEELSEKQHFEEHFVKGYDISSLSMEQTKQYIEMVRTAANDILTNVLEPLFAEMHEKHPNETTIKIATEDAYQEDYALYVEDLDPKRRWHFHPNRKLRWDIVWNEVSQLAMQRGIKVRWNYKITVFIDKQYIFEKKV